MAAKPESAAAPPLPGMAVETLRLPPELQSRVAETATRLKITDKEALEVIRQEDLADREHDKKTFHSP